MLRYALLVNPEPWTVPAMQVVRARNSGKHIAVPSPDANLASYQRAIKEALEDQRPILIDYEVRLQLYFWRQLAVYQGNKRKETRNQADVTNMQKATEDAIQGVLLSNDRLVRHVQSTLVAQGPDVVGKVGICIEPWSEIGSDFIVAQFEWPTYAKDDNSWP